MRSIVAGEGARSCSSPMLGTACAAALSADAAPSGVAAKKAARSLAEPPSPGWEAAPPPWDGVGRSDGCVPSQNATKSSNDTTFLPRPSSLTASAASSAVIGSPSFACSAWTHDRHRRGTRLRDFAVLSASERRGRQRTPAEPQKCARMTYPQVCHGDCTVLVLVEQFENLPHRCQLVGCDVHFAAVR